MNETQIIPAHQWTNGDGEVLIVRQVQKDGSSSRGFVWPLTVGAAVKCPDWVPAPECGHGLHGWPLGLHIGDGAAPDPAMTWLVVGAQPSDVVSIGGAKVKMRRGVVRHVGTMGSARAFVRDALVAWVRHSATTGYGAHSATTGDGAHSATTGDGAHSATTGDGAHSATTGDGAHSATTGARAHSATTGAYAVACALGVARGLAWAAPSCWCITTTTDTRAPRRRVSWTAPTARSSR